MEQIKENMFFVVCGIIVLLAVAFHFFINGSRARANLDGIAKAAELAGHLQKSAIPGAFVPDASAVAAAQQYHKAYEAEFQQIEDLFRTKTLLGRLPGDMVKVFATIDDVPKELDGEIVAKDAQTIVVRTITGDETVRRDNVTRIENETSNPAVFSKVYGDLVKEVQRKMSGPRFHVEKDAWPYWDWGTKLPESEPQRIAAAKEYYLTSEVVELIKRRKLGIVALDRLEIEPGVVKNDTYNAQTVKEKHERVGDYFQAIPFTLAVKMDFQKWRLLVDELLKAKYPIFIRRISMGRISIADRAVLLKESVIPALQPPIYVDVRLECWALDYTEAKQQKAPTGGPGFAGLPTSSRTGPTAPRNP